MNARIQGDQYSPGAATPFYNAPGAPASPFIRGPRAMFGLALNHGGQTDGNVTGGSWLQSFASGGAVNPVIAWDYVEDQARLASVSDFGIGASGASRTNGLDAIGVAGFAVASHANSFKAWGGYFDAARVIAGAGSVTGIEVNAAQVQAASPGNVGWSDFWLYGRTPYKSTTSGEAISTRIAGGSDAAVFGTSFAVDAGIDFVNNGGAMWTGINFRFNAIMRVGITDDKTDPGNTGYARAISMAHDQGLSWYSRDAVLVTAGAFVIGRTYIIQSVGTTNFIALGAASNTIGVSFVATGVGSGTGTASLAGSQGEVVRIYSSCDSEDTRIEQVFSDTAISWNETVSPGAALFQIDYISNAGANIYVEAGPIGGTATVGSRGANANITLTLAPKGTGWLAFGSIANCPAYADDAAAAAGGLGIGAIYRTGSNLKVRVS
jgi:hypothetical protein